MIVMLISAATEAAHSTSTMHIDWGWVGAWIRAGLSAASIFVGLFFVFAGTIGVLRLPDFYTRIHAAGMTDTLGAEMILLGLIIQAGFSQMTLKLLMISFAMMGGRPWCSRMCDSRWASLIHARHWVFSFYSALRISAAQKPRWSTANPAA